MMRTPSDQRARDAAAAKANLRAIEQQAGVLAPHDAGRRPDDEAEDLPPLDWRLTPRNIALQLLALALFLGAMWVIATIFVGGISALFGG